MKTYNWIENTTRIVEILTTLLSSENILNLKIRKYHWNVEGVHFKDYHSFLEELYWDSSENIDDIAERIRALWEYAPATFSEYLKNSILKEDSEIWIKAEIMFENLTNDKKDIILFLRKSIEEISEIWDAWTEDFLIATLQKHEKELWMISSISK